MFENVCDTEGARRRVALLIGIDRYERGVPPCSMLSAMSKAWGGYCANATGTRSS